jgi:hypothetical protein
MKGVDLPHSSYFSFTAIDDHRALIFGGNICGRRYDNLYLIDFNTMVSVTCLLVKLKISTTENYPPYNVVHAIIVCVCIILLPRVRSKR